MTFFVPTARSAFALGLLTTLVVVAGCDAPPQLNFKAELGTKVAIVEPRIRTPLAGRPTAGYFGLDYIASADDRIIAVSSPAFKRVEMHDTVTEGTMKKMVKLDGLDVPANSSIKFEPGGKHLMMFEPATDLKAGDEADVTFVFTKSGPKIVAFRVQDIIPLPGPVDAADKMDHSKMDHSKMDHGTMNHDDTKH